MAQDARRKKRRKTMFVMVMNVISSKQKKKKKRDCVCDSGEWDKQQEKEGKKSQCL